MKSVCVCHETKHLSEESANGSSSDATGNNWRFQAENLRQITIYQLMKPLKMIPHPPVPTVLRAALLTQALPALRGAAWAWVTISLLMLYSLFYRKTYFRARESETKLILNKLQEHWHENISVCFQRTQRKRFHMYLPSVECTWTSVMRNQQKICSFSKEHAMALMVCGRFLCD